MFEEVLEILDRPRTIACALALDRTRPTNLTRSLDKDRPINVYAREVMESVKPFDNHHIRRTNVDFTSACVRFETPLWHTRRAPRAKFAQIMGETNEVGGFGEIAQMFRRPVVIGQVVIGREDDHAATWEYGCACSIGRCVDRRVHCDVDCLRVPTHLASHTLRETLSETLREGRFSCRHRARDTDHRTALECQSLYGDRVDRFFKAKDTGLRRCHGREHTVTTGRLPYLATLETP
jgi:hypothetical protein